MIYNFLKMSGDSEAVLEFSDLSHVQLKNGIVPAFDTEWDEVLSPVTDGPTDNILESRYKMHVQKSVELKYVLQDKKNDQCKLKLMARGHLE